VIGNATHRDGLAFFAIAGSESDLKRPGSDEGVVEEKFVEIAETEEEEGAGMLGFDVVVLAEERGGGFRHFGKGIW
jgi:hypothetical protein